jgi:hypothetical protein
MAVPSCDGLSKRKAGAGHGQRGRHHSCFGSALRGRLCLGTVAEVRRIQKEVVILEDTPPVLQRILRYGNDEQAGKALTLYNETWRRVFVNEKLGAQLARLRATTAVIKYARSEGL